jgi:hypothetical protein
MAECTAPEMRDVLPDLAADRLTGEALARAVAHLGTCSDCAREVEILRAAKRALSRSVPEIDTSRIVAALPKPPSKVASPRVATPRLVSPQIIPRRRTRPIAHRAVAATGRASLTHRTSWTAWRIAAVATVAVGGLSLALLGRKVGVVPMDNGHTTHVTSVGPNSSPVQSPLAESLSAAAPLVSTPPSQTEPAPPTQGAASAEGLAVAGDVSELSDGEIKTLLDSLDGVEAEPSAEPDQVAPGMSSVVP